MIDYHCAKLLSSGDKLASGDDMLVLGDLPSRRHVVVCSSIKVVGEMVVLSISCELGVLLNILSAPFVLVKKP